MLRRQLSIRLLATLALASATGAAEPGVRWETGGEVAGYLDTDHVWALTPSAYASAREPSAGWNASGSYLVDIVSAASVDIVSAASPRWFEVRHAGALSGGYKPGAAAVSASLATSIEPDFTSFAAGATGSHDFARKNLVLSLGYVYEHAVAGRTGTPFSVYALRADRHQLAARAEIVVGPATLLSPALDVHFESGRQEKPYRWLPLFDAAVASSVPVGASIDEVNQLRLPGRVAEHLPDTRQRYAASARLAHRFARSTLTLWDRAYLDSWGLLATTTDVKWVFELSRRWSVWPHLRFHDQSAATFWRRAYVGRIGAGSVVVPEHRSGDRELSPFWTATAGPGLRFDLGSPTPRSLSATLEFDGAYTQFRDALYIDHRWSGLAVAGFSARFE